VAWQLRSAGAKPRRFALSGFGMMDVERVYRQLVTHRIGRDLRFYPVAGSTMDIARALAEEGAPEGVTVVADEQTAGRGRLGRAWVAPPGVNLYVSILVRPAPERLKRLGMVAPLAVADAVGTHLDMFHRIVVGTASVTAVAYGTDGPLVLTLNAYGDLPQLGGRR